MPKIYILDTNVLLHDPNAIYKFEDNNIVIPFAVIEEIDSQKGRQDEVGRHAREVNRVLDGLRTTGSLSTGVCLPNGGKLRIELNHQSTPEGLLVKDAADNRILAVAYNLSKDLKEEVILVTKDLNLRIKANAFSLKTEDFYNDKIDSKKLYDKTSEIYIQTNEMNEFYKEGKIIKNIDNSFSNQFFILKSNENSSQSALARYYNGMLHKLHFADDVMFGIQAKNIEQKFAMELLLNNSIKVVTLLGHAGTGKTLLSLAAALELVYESSMKNDKLKYSRIIVTRPTIPMGRDIGFLPGDVQEKLRPWMSPIYDNFDYLLSKVPEPSSGIVEELKARGLLEMDALTYIRGRSIPKQFFICDEAQNLTPKEVKTIVTRMGEGSKLILTGDPEQIDNPYLDSSSNGLTYLTNKFKDQKIFGSVTFLKSERSEIAELGAKLL